MSFRLASIGTELHGEIWARGQVVGIAEGRRGRGYTGHLRCAGAGVFIFAATRGSVCWHTGTAETDREPPEPIL